MGEDPGSKNLRAQMLLILPRKVTAYLDCCITKLPWPFQLSNVPPASFLMLIFLFQENSSQKIGEMDFIYFLQLNYLDDNNTIVATKYIGIVTVGFGFI